MTLISNIFSVDIARAQADAGFKAASPGTTMVWRKIGADDSTNVVIGASYGMNVSWTSNGKERAATFLFCWACNPNRYFVDATQVQGLFPLETGKSAIFKRSYESRDWTDTVTVKERKTIEIPAGQFDVFVIETKSENFTGSWNGVRINYFSPALGWNVKLETTDSEGRNYAWQVVEVNGKTGVKY